MTPARLVCPLLAVLLLTANGACLEPSIVGPAELETSVQYLRACFRASCDRKPVRLSPPPAMSKAKNGVSVTIVLGKEQYASASATQSSLAGNIRLATARAVAGKPLGDLPLILTIRLPGEERIPPPVLPSKLEKITHIGRHVATATLRGKQSALYPAEALLRDRSWKELLFQLGTDLSPVGASEKEILTTVTRSDLQLTLSPCVILAVLPGKKEPVLLNQSLPGKPEQITPATAEKALKRALPWYRSTLQRWGDPPADISLPSSTVDFESFYCAAQLACRFEDSLLKRQCSDLIERCIRKQYIEAPDRPSGYIQLKGKPATTATAYLLLTALAFPELLEKGPAARPLRHMAYYAMHQFSSDTTLACAAAFWIRRRNSELAPTPLRKHIIRTLTEKKATDRMWSVKAARELYATTPYKEMADRIIALAAPWQQNGESPPDMAYLANRACQLKSAWLLLRTSDGKQSPGPLESNLRAILAAILDLQTTPALAQLRGQENLSGGWRAHEGTLQTDPHSTNLAVIALLQAYTQEK